MERNPDDTRSRARAWSLWQRAILEDIRRHLERQARRSPPPKPDDATKCKTQPKGTK